MTVENAMKNRHFELFSIEKFLLEFVFLQALSIVPDDGFALVHLGFIVKAEDDFPYAISLLKRGIESEEEGTQQGKFYMHLGDALHRSNRTAEVGDNLLLS